MRSTVHFRCLWMALLPTFATLSAAEDVFVDSNGYVIYCPCMGNVKKRAVKETLAAETSFHFVSISAFAVYRCCARASISLPRRANCSPARACACLQVDSETKSTTSWDRLPFQRRSDGLWFCRRGELTYVCPATTKVQSQLRLSGRHGLLQTLGSRACSVWCICLTCSI